jgi:non-specific serine/threonine protein kinase/serine/threonine-protein kinase
MSAPGRWREIESVVAGALDLPAGQRAAYVDSVCGTDSPVSAEVRALIRAYEHAGDFLDPLTYADKWAGTEADALEGKVVGSYRLNRALGRGGMGVVYLASRDDGEFEKEVAVKLMNSALYSPGMARRFHDERQILASLEHPNIARLLDAGLTSEGIPFIVMEYVDGEPIHEYCRRRSLPVRERLMLFVKVCDAVHFAHRNLVVHRDLKPSNILVTADGCPKLLDFGVAKMLAGAGVEPAATAPLTQALTPDYASPEQLRGGNLTTASDVYSLGVLLYELLVGHRPYVLAGKPLDEILRTVCDEEPAGLSASAAPQNPKLAKELKGDLDHMVAKALRKPASERYGSAEELARDIGRHLEGLPVEARRGSLAYTVSRYFRRYRLALAAALAVLLLAGIGVAAIVRQMRIAERRFQEVRRLAHSVIFELHDGIARLPGAIPVRKLLVTRALEFLDPLAREAQNNRALTIELAQAYIRIGEVQGGFTMASEGQDAAARTSFQKAHDLLLPLYRGMRQHFAAEPAVTITRAPNALASWIAAVPMPEEPP